MEIVCTMKEWIKSGPKLVQIADIDFVQFDKKPLLTHDTKTPHGSYMWQHGWRWMDETEMGTWTIPTNIWDYLEFNGRRWPNEAEASVALSKAAILWAKFGPK